jgi:hypothetical protein
VADSLRTTSGIVAIISLVLFGVFFVVLDFVGPRRNFCGNSNANKKKKANLQVQMRNKIQKKILMIFKR